MAKRFNKNKDQRIAPIYDALVEYQNRKVIPLHTPGHKGIGNPIIKTLLTDLGQSCDLPSMDATDNTFHPNGCISQAQNLAAELYNASDSFYLVNGATIGIHAAFLAAVKPGDKILLPRNFHISVFAALVFCGAEPVYIPTKWLDGAGPIPSREEEFSKFLKKNKNIRAVFLTHPTYYGIGRSLGSISSLCHRNNIPLIVDEAHGAHLHFLPEGNLRSALDYGADVVIQSVHKNLGSLVGTAQMHRGQNSLISKGRLQSMLNLFQSTSSNYLLLSSLDIVRSLMYHEGNQLFTKSVRDAISLSKKLNSIPGIEILSTDYSPTLTDCSIDPLRLTINISDLGITGIQTELLLYKQFNILCEFCDNRNVVFVLSPYDSLNWYNEVVKAFQKISDENYHLGKNALPSLDFFLKPNVILTPREATFKPKTKIPLNKSVGCISGELITSYPPGIPIICPGEEITYEIINYCQWLSNQPSYIFAEDKTLSTISILNL